MRDYAKIAPQFWIGPTGKAIRKLGAEAQVIALYLLSSPHANMIGLYHLPIAYISADTGIPFEGACKTLGKLQETGFCGYDHDAEVVFIYEMARYQIAEALKPGDKQCLGVQNAYNNVPKNRYLSDFFDYYATAFNLVEKRVYEAPCKPLRSQEQEQEQEQKQEQDCSAPPATPASPPKKSLENKPDIAKETELQAACREVWSAYCKSFFERYDTEPVRNATINTQVKQFVQRIGRAESPEVIAFYVGHNGQFYVRNMHQIGYALKDAEKLRAEWATNRQITETQARQTERTQSNISAADEAMRILEAQGAEA